MEGVALMLIVKESEGKGRGVFTDAPIKEGEEIERSAVIPLTREETTHIDNTALKNYWFNWGSDGGAIGLGLLSLYNHSDEQNARYMPLTCENEMVIIANRDIEAGEEILINYKNKEKFDF